MRRNSLFRLLAVMSAMVIGLMSATRAFAEGSVYIKANLTDVKIGDLYYDLNTKTHKAAVVYQHNSGDVENYKGLTNVVIPSKVKFALPLQEEITYDVVEIGEEAFRNNTTITSISIPSSIICITTDIWSHGIISGYFWEQNPDCRYDEGYYVDGCLVYTKHDSYGNPANRDNLYVFEW